ncbi:MAG: hypothetical protein AAGJ51_00110 [Pseudomonadota bacterium]
MTGVTGVMFAVKAAFNILEAARNIAEARASRFDFEIVFSPLPAGNPLELARQHLSKSENWSASGQHNHILAEYADCILDQGDFGRFIDPDAPDERQTQLCLALNSAFSAKVAEEELKHFQSTETLQRWVDNDAGRRDRARLILRMSGLALEYISSHTHRLGLRGQAQTIVGAISDSIAGHIERNKSTIIDTAFTKGAGARIAEALLTTSLEIAETRPELFSDKESVQALVRSAISPFRELNSANASLDLNATQRLMKIREVLRGPVATGVIQTLYEHRRNVFDGDYPERGSAAGIVTDALFEGLVAETSESGRLASIFTPGFFVRTYPSVLQAVSASPEAFVRGSGQHIELGREFLTGLMQSLSAVESRPQLAQHIFQMGMEMTRRHARVYLVEEARAALSAELAERLDASDSPWALMQIKILSHIADGMISHFEAKGLDLSILSRPTEQDFLLDMVGLVAEQVSLTPGMILGDDVNPEIVNIARGVAAFIANEHASLISRSDWQRVSAHAVSLAMANPETLFSLDASDPEDALAVTLVQQILSSAQASLTAQADGSAALNRQPGQILFGRTLADALMATLDLATSHARQLATESGQAALNQFIEQLNSLATMQGVEQLSSQDWIYAFRWFLSDVVSTGQGAVSSEMILSAVDTMRKGRAMTANAPTDPFDFDHVRTPTGDPEVYYQPVPPQGAEG